MIVMKFGGTSVGDADHIRRAVEIVRSRIGRAPVIVVSAQAGVTDDLIDLAEQAKDRETNTAALEKGFGDLLEDLGLPGDLLADEIDELRALLQGITLVGDLTPRSLDRMMSYGERCSARIVAAALAAGGLAAEAVMSYDIGLLTDSHHGHAQVLRESYPVLAENLRSRMAKGPLQVVTGFVAKDAEGFITTLGRSGSDYTAAILGAALDVELIEIWTDVDGVMSADPRIVEDARRLERMSFAEAAELAYYGARVIHPATIQPAVRRDIPIRVLNSKEPDRTGTEILHRPEGLPPGPRSIATKAHISLVHVTSLRMLLQHGFMARLFAVFEKHRVVIDMISTSEVSVSLTTDSGSARGLPAAVEELRGFAEVRTEPDKAIICLVGEGLRDAVDVLERIFSTLRRSDIPVRVVSVGASRINVSLLVDHADERRAVQALHNEFFQA